MRVQFKPKIREKIKLVCATGNGWAEIDNWHYPMKMLEIEYFEVRPCGSLYYFIIKPGNLYSHFLIVKHTIPYLPIKFDLDDKLFEWGE
jgi:hypothetical protein